MDWTDGIVRIIELNTFSNVWYWLIVVGIWSVVSNWLIGVPFDMLFRARRYGTAELADVEGLVDIHVRRIAAYHHSFGHWLIGLIAFVLSGVGFAGFYYGLELGQGLFVLGAPLCLIGAINVRLALELNQTPLAGKDLVHRLFRVRLWTQIIAMVTMFFTAMYGMYFSLAKLQFF
ncbi:hypothetical protein [Loktanella sp. Alg231-35]|uniref:hypothetical protein n=1 Tax=Loktanella sp. Alg231-35 TaxID=1922220 RepID=UPI000D558F82|nr:hypothetical protein [Loktanella sp. Alg231-35]